MKKFYIVFFSVVLSACSTVTSANKVEKTSQTRDETITIVSCQGKTIDEAKKICFKNAVQDVVGVAITSEKEVFNNEVTKNEILNYSAGYVNEYEILSKQVIDKQVHLEMLVKIASSKLQDRILGKFKDTKLVDGERHAAQYETYIQDRTNGDEFLRNILYDYPSKAFNVKLVGQEYMVDSGRSAIVVIYYELEWNQNYLTALNEALQKTADKRSRSIKQHPIYVQSNPKDSFFGSSESYYFNDTARAKLIRDTFVGQITVVASLVDEKNVEVANNCSHPVVFVGLMNDMIHAAYQPYVIPGNRYDHGNVRIKINSPAKADNLAKVTKINLSFRKGACYNSNR